MQCSNQHTSLSYTILTLQTGAKIEGKKKRVIKGDYERACGPPPS